MTAGKRKKFLAVLLGIAMVPIAVLFTLGGWLGFALTQHESVAISTIAASAARLEWTGSDLVVLSPSGIWLERAYKHGVFQMHGDALDQVLARRGWKHRDQEGSGRVYTSGAGILRVNCHMFSAHYQVCQAHDAW